MEKFFPSLISIWGTKDQWTSRACPDCSPYDFANDVLAEHGFFCLRVDGWGVAYVSMGGVLASGVVVVVSYELELLMGLNFIRKGGSLTGVECLLP